MDAVRDAVGADRAIQTAIAVGISPRRAATLGDVEDADLDIPLLLMQERHEIDMCVERSPLRTGEFHVPVPGRLSLSADPVGLQPACHLNAQHSLGRKPAHILFLPDRKELQRPDVAPHQMAVVRQYNENRIQRSVIDRFGEPHLLHDLKFMVVQRLMNNEGEDRCQAKRHRQVRMLQILV